MKTSRGILSADYKVVGGKLLRVALSLKEGENYQYISAITITGDFFMHPEDAIETLEHTLIGVMFQEEAIEQAVNMFFVGGVEVIGAKPADFVHIILSVK